MADINGDLTQSSSRWMMPFLVFFRDARLVLKMDSLGREILRIAFPAALALAADPIASLIDTAFIGRLGPVELAAVGVSIAIFNQASRVTIFPLVSITTSFVAEEDTVEKMNNIESTSEEDDSEKSSGAAIVVPVETQETRKSALPEDAMEKGIADTLPAPKTAETNEAAPENAVEKGVSSDASNKPRDPLPSENGSDKKIVSGNKSNNKAKGGKGKKNIPSASTALVLGSILGLLQAIFLIFGSKFLLRVMGVKPNSPMMAPAHKYLVLRSLGAPAVLLSLAMQGIFRGFKDTKTPLYATVVGDLMNIILDPIFMFVLRLGVSGAAIAHVLSQYLISLILILRLTKNVDLMPPSLRALQFSRFLKNGFLLLGRVIAVTFCVTLAASMAARLGATPMAAFQICLQVWLTSSLLADGLAVAGQAILACAFAEKDYKKVNAATARVLQMGFVLGLGLAVFVGLGLYFGSGMFSKDPSVIHLIAIGIPFVAATQPINCLAFVLDGVNFGASDFAYTAYSMIIVAAVSIVSVIYMAKSNGFIGIWIALTIYMALRFVAGIGRMGTGTGPWEFLRGRSSS